ncbi:acyl-CoA dehydrogenase [candidate division GN15 bacterium]|nr:acyl-CoA dehydrogenase [candidate division GN15 bacterium]
MIEQKHHDFRNQVREFMESTIAPLAAALDEEQRFPDEHMKPLTDQGYMSMLIPEKYGGKPTDTVSYSIVVEEASRVCGSTGIMLAAHNSLGCFPILKFGSEAQREKYLPRAAKGELLAFGLSEPDAGSDAGGTRTMALKQDDHWLVNGSKCWITSATKAFATIASARTSENPEDREITCFILDKDWDGYSVGKKENKLGLRGSDTAFLHFDDLKAPLDSQLGEIGEGFKQMLITLDGGRISIGAMALGLGQGAFECALKYSAERVQFGKPISYNQGIQHILADMATELEAARLLIYEASQMKDAGVPFGHYSAMAKLYASEVGRRVSEKALSILGSVGCLTGEYSAERIWRDVKLCEIGEGTSEIQRLVIARKLLKDLQNT